jgi:hypothetical protein
LGERAAWQPDIARPRFRSAPLSIVAFFVWPLWPDDILDVIQADWFAGLMGLDFGYLLSNVFAFPLFLVLYVTLKEVDQGWALIALTLGVLGLVCLVPATPRNRRARRHGGLASVTRPFGSPKTKPGQLTRKKTPTWPGPKLPGRSASRGVFCALGLFTSRHHPHPAQLGAARWESMVLVMLHPTCFRWPIGRLSALACREPDR